MKVRIMYKRKECCDYCRFNLLAMSASEVRNHIRWCELNPNRTHPKKKYCHVCNIEHTRISKYCSDICRDIKIECNKSVTNLKISNGRKKFLFENPDKHPWKSKDKFKSVPCEKVKEYLTVNNIKFVEEWQPLDDRFFSIDIAFPDIKFGIEINGNQHYNSDGTLKLYYQERHDLIVANGWKLLELHYSSCFNIDTIKDIFDIGNQPDYSEYFKIQQEKKSIKIVTMPMGMKVKLTTDLKWESYKDIILQSDVDFSKYGWATKVSDILNIKHQKVSSWMKRYLPEFYEQSCFKRK